MFANLDHILGPYFLLQFFFLVAYLVSRPFTNSNTDSILEIFIDRPVKWNVIFLGIFCLPMILAGIIIGTACWLLIKGWQLLDRPIKNSKE